MKKLSIVFLFVLSACGVTPYYDPELLPYLEKFKVEMNIKADYVSLYFGELKSPTIGRCSFGVFPNTYITIDRDFWDSTTADGKEQLMYHELGHCVLYLMHDDELVNYQGYQIPSSIMNSYFFGEAWFYTDLKDQYKEALKTDSRINP